jgi:hypothetical protein
VISGTHRTRLYHRVPPQQRPPPCHQPPPRPRDRLCRSSERLPAGRQPRCSLQAADAVTGSKKPIAPEHADTISVLTDNLSIMVETYGDAARAIRRWFLEMREPGARHRDPCIQPFSERSAAHILAVRRSATRRVVVLACVELRHLVEQASHAAR